jgi:polyphenol oxidase
VAVPVRWFVTDRAGGASTGPYEGLNLGLHVGDDERIVADNRARVAARAGVRPDALVFMDQVHGRDVAVIDGPVPADIARVDGVVTRARGLALAVMVADCVPVLLADDEAGVIGAAHAGRAGMALGVVGATVDAMRGVGARRLRAHVGPAICPGCYEVPAALRDEVAALVPQAAARSASGTPAIDVRAGVLAQLAAAGVTEISFDARCTRQSPELYSYRRSSVTGRFAGVVVLDEGRA